MDNTHLFSLQILLIVASIITSAPLYEGILMCMFADHGEETLKDDTLSEKSNLILSEGVLLYKSCS